MTESPMPQPCENDSGAELGKIIRRSFFGRLSFWLTGLIGGIIAAPPVAFVLAPVFLRVPQRWRSVGKLDVFPIGQTVKVEFDDTSPLPWAGVTARTGAWLRRETETEFIAFSINCRHLGCPVRWLPDAHLFMCPCHGGVYYQDGTVAAGPPPAALMRYRVRIEGSQVEIETSPIPLPGDVPANTKAPTS